MPHPNHYTFVALTEGGSKGPLRWVQVAHEGEWKGHRSGAFQLTAVAFQEVVRNFNAHPKHKSNGGNGRVVAFDMHHASESPFDAPLEHTLAHAWAHELEIRPGRGGRKELWALTEYLPKTREWIASGRVEGVSGAFALSARDPVTGEAIGCKLTSVAFTNQPFLTGMSPLAASETYKRKDTNMALKEELVSRLKLSSSATDEEITVKLDSILKKSAELERTSAESEVEHVILANGLDPRAKPALLSMRLTDETAFRTTYPALPRGVAPDALVPVSRQVNGGAPPPSGMRALDGIQVGPNGQLVMSGGPVNNGNKAVQARDFALKLLAVPGVNKHDRAINYVRQLPGGDKLSFDAAHTRASMLLAENGIPAHVTDVTQLV